MNKYDWLVVGVTAAFVAAMIAVGSEPSGGFVKVLTHPSSAAWIQAIGSVLAILAAVGVAGWQTANAIEQKRSQEQKRISALQTAAADIAQFAHDYIHSPAMFLRDPLSRPRLRKEGLSAMAFKIADDAILAFPFYELNDPAITRILNDMRGGLASTERIGNKILALPEGDPNIEVELQALWHVTDQAVEDLNAVGALAQRSVRPGPFDIVAFREDVAAEAKQKQWPGAV